MKVIAALALAGTAAAAPTRTHFDVEKMFESWMQEFEMDFESATEYLHRLAIFAENVEKIELHNSGNHTYSMAMNQFGHLTGEEFKAQYTGLAVPPVDNSLPRVSFNPEAEAPASSSVDWTTKGAVTPVKNQASCGSCWSFSTTGGLEGAYYLKNNELVSFSEQQLVSCDTTDQGCNGGLMDNAFAWIKKNGGLCKEEDYPYTSGTGRSGTCKKSCTVVEGSTVTGFTDVSPSPQVVPASESVMEQAVTKQPISVAIEADQSSFQFYKSGVMTGSCGTQLDHGVLVVGYGTDSGTKYWKIKNSWGATWGDDGYIKIKKGTSQKGDSCGVTLSASYPNL